MAKHFTIESARNTLRNMGMEEDRGSLVMNLYKKPIGLTGFAAIDFLRSKGVRILVKSALAHEAEEAKKSHKVSLSKCTIHSKD